jgi:DnaJ-class molecular chaperone
MRDRLTEVTEILASLLAVYERTGDHRHEGFPKPGDCVACAARKALTPTPETVFCPSCLGEGAYPTLAVGGGPPHMIWVDCTKCNKTGQVPRVEDDDHCPDCGGEIFGVPGSDCGRPDKMHIRTE